MYHYLEPFISGQAAHFVNTVGEREPELGYWGDLEDGSLDAAKCEKFLNATDVNLAGIESEEVCHVYTRASFFDRFGTPEWAQGRLLWVAHWADVPEPTLPQAWTEWEFWQTTSDGSVPGIEGRVDLDVYAGTPEQLYNAYGNGGEEPSMDLQIFDKDGNLQDWDWLTANYGDIRIQKPDAESYFKIVEIRERHDDSTFIVKVLNEDGSPRVGKGVVFYWPGVEAAPGSGWLEQGVIGDTNENGDVGFGMGTGAYYEPPAGGPHKSWLFGDNISEMVEGIGMLVLTNHDHVNITYQWVESDDPEPVDPEDGDLSEVVEQLASIDANLKRIADAAEAFAAWVTRP